MNREDAEWVLDTLARRRPEYQLRRDYYRGAHKLLFLSDKMHQAFGGLFKAFADNISGVVVDAVAERLRITGWGLTEGDRDAGQVAAAEARWAEDQLAMVAREVHLEALQVGDTFLIVWPGEDGRPVWHPNVAEEVVVRYDVSRPGRIVLAGKAWVDTLTKYPRLTLYYPDRVERYIAQAKSTNGAIPDKPDGFVPFDGATDGGAVVPNPWDVVPVFHFPNRAPVGRRGVAEHERAIPVQDALNMAMVEVLVAGEFVSLPQRWAVGIDLPRDPVTNEQVPLKSGAGVLWSTDASEGARFGEFAAGDIRQLLEVANDHRAEVARLTGTPPHRLMLNGDGQWPSGEALQVAEAPLVAKIEDKQEVWGSVWGWAMALGMRMAQAPAERPLRPVWKDAATRSELSAVSVLEAKVRLGMSRAQALRELGYTDEEVVAMLEEAAEERTRAMDTGAVL